MDKNEETILIKTFFKKQYQKRFLFELFSDKKREETIWKLSSALNKYFITKYMIKIPKSNTEPKKSLNY